MTVTSPVGACAAAGAEIRSESEIRRPEDQEKTTLELRTPNSELMIS
jgi:hypothetical protein